MRRRQRHARPARIVAAAALVAGAAVAVRLKGSGVLRRGVRGPGGAPTAAHTTWTCACGQDIRSAGLGRHQVHWLADAPEDEPVLGDACPSCGRPLPVTDA
ncbi:MAG TPA: hypothetical protein VFT50_13875 [Baekduia sp.]|nr:hypothetical protein [Baekduia sp.]